MTEDTLYSLADAEKSNRVWTDAFAQDRGWEEYNLRDPVQDLELFFTSLSGSRVLDVGCGFGRYVYRFLEQGIQYEGIDHSEEMLKVAQDTNPQTSFVLGSLSALPYSEGSFDGVWSCCSLNDFPKRYLADILQEHLRVLRVGGVMYIILPAHMPAGEVMYYDEHNNPVGVRSHYHPAEFWNCLQGMGCSLVGMEFRLENGSSYVCVRKDR